jgi:hypothetical protein
MSFLKVDGKALGILECECNYSRSFASLVYSLHKLVQASMGACRRAQEAGLAGPRYRRHLRGE